MSAYETTDNQRLLHKFENIFNHLVLRNFWDVFITGISNVAAGLNYLSPSNPTLKKSQTTKTKNIPNTIFSISAFHIYKPV